MVRGSEQRRRRWSSWGRRLMRREEVDAEMPLERGIPASKSGSTRKRDSTTHVASKEVRKLAESEEDGVLSCVAIWDSDQDV